MEAGLEVYARPHAPQRPLVGLDERTKEQQREGREPLPVAPGAPARDASSYERNGVANRLLFFAPLETWRAVNVTDRRTASDWAACLQDLLDTHFPAAATPHCG